MQRAAHHSGLIHVSSLPFHQEADLAAGSLTVTPSRAAVVAFSAPFLEFRYTALLRKPRRRRLRLRTAAQLLASDIPYGVVRGSIAQVTRDK